MYFPLPLIAPYPPFGGRSAVPRRAERPTVRESVCGTAAYSIAHNAREENDMLRWITGAGAIVTVAAVLAAGALAHPSATTLKGTVGPGFTISLTTGGKKVTSLKAGTYKIVVSDKASVHNFVLERESGGKFEKDITSVPFVGTKTFTVKLAAGKWKYYCAPHESGMSGEFDVM